MKKKTLLRRIALAVLGLIGVVVIGFIVWANWIYQAEPEKLLIASDETKNDFRISEKTDYWEITPTGSDAQSTKYNDTGLIFYPGAKVEPKAYFYKLSDLSNGQAGKIKVFITKPTLNLAVFGINQADKVIQDHPEVKKWIIGGHSLGGAMSCEYARNHAEKVSQLWLFGSYCGSDISNLNINVSLIHGALDGVLSPQKLAENRKNLPPTASDFQIEGMNHAQVGNYGTQSGDNEPTKNDEDVRNEMIKIFSQLLSK